MRRIGLAVAGVVVAAACGTSPEAVTPTDAVTVAAAPSTTSAPAVVTTQAPAEEGAASVCRGCVEPPSLPQWAAPQTPGNPQSEPLKQLAAGTFTSRLFQPVVTFAVPTGWATSGENAFGLTVSTRFNPLGQTGTFIDILNPAEAGLSELDWDALMGRLQTATRSDGSSPLEPIAESGVTYESGGVSEGEVGGFPAHTIDIVGAHSDILLPIHTAFLARFGQWVRYTLVDVGSERVLLVLGVRNARTSTLRDAERQSAVFLVEAQPVIDSLIISP